MIRKIIAIITFLSIAICLLPELNADAASDFIIKRDSSGNSYLSGYSGKGGEITLPNSVAYIGDEAFKGVLSITRVTVPSSCKIVGSKAFSGCLKLKEVVFEGSNITINNSAFSDCGSLENVIFKKSSAKASIGKNAFKNCFVLKNINLPSNTSAISEFAFGNCISMNYITVPESASVSGKAIGYMYDEKTKSYFIADGETEAYISTYELYKGKAIEWYAPKKGKTLIMNVVKGSDAEKYAQRNGIEYVRYQSAAVPSVTAEADTESVSLKWNMITGADAYRVYISSGNGFKVYKESSAKNCKVSGLESGKTYTFKVAVLVRINGNRYSEVSCSENISVAVKGKNAQQSSSTNVKKASIPAAPVVTAVSDSTSVTLEWKRVIHADAYKISVFNEQKNKYEAYRIVTSKSCVITGLESGKEYRFKVTSLYRTGVKNKYSDGGASGDIVISTSRVVVSR